MNILISKISLKINGKNINRFIKKLRTNKIDILSLKYKNSNEANIIIYKKDYQKLLKIKSIYEVTEIDVFGFVKVEKKLRKSRHLIIVLFISFLSLFFLTNIIFSIEIVHSNRGLRNLVYRELKNNGIKKYAFKKNYKQISKIKEKILSKYPDKIEWLEIESNGTKYVVKVQERHVEKEKDDTTLRNIIAKKSGVIKKVIAEDGDIVKDMDDYVKKGDLIINGELIFNNKVTGRVRANGKVYAEVWYVTKIDYPLYYQAVKETGNEKNVYAIKFLNHYFEFTFDRYKNKKIKEKVILKHPNIPLEFVRQNQKEVKYINQILTFDEVLGYAKKESIKQMKDKLKKDEYIIRSKYLKTKVKKSIVEVEMFFAIYEDITDYQEIR